MLNRNPLNIRLGEKWEGQAEIAGDREFVTFKSKMYGYRAAFRVLRTYHRRGWNTLEKIISHWAPSSENDTRSYISFVEQKTGIPAGKVLMYSDKQTMVRLVSAMAQLESRITGDDLFIEEAYEMAQ